MQVQIPLFEKEDKDGNTYFVAAPDFPLSVKLNEVFFLAFPNQERPQMIIRSAIDKPKRDQTEDTE